MFCTWTFLRIPVPYPPHSAFSLCVPLLPPHWESPFCLSNPFTSVLLFCFPLSQNPLPFLGRYPDADVLASSDLLVDTMPDDQLEEFDKGG